MSRSYHQSKSREFILGKNTTKFKNKNKIPHDIDWTACYGGKKSPCHKVYWKYRKHIAYGELRNFRFRGIPTYAGESYNYRVGEYITPVIEPAKERRKNKISIYSNFEE